MDQKLIIQEMTSEICDYMTGSRAPKFSELVPDVASLVYTAEYILRRDISAGTIRDHQGNGQNISDYKLPVVVVEMAKYSQVYMTDSIANSGKAKAVWDVCDNISHSSLKDAYIQQYNGKTFAGDDGSEAVFDGKWCHIMTPVEIDRFVNHCHCYIRNGSVVLKQIDKKVSNLYDVGAFLGADGRMHYLRADADGEVAAVLQLLGLSWDGIYDFVEDSSLMTDSAIRTFIRKNTILAKERGESK